MASDSWVVCSCWNGYCGRGKCSGAVQGPLLTDPTYVWLPERHLGVAATLSHADEPSCGMLGHYKASRAHQGEVFYCYVMIDIYSRYIVGAHVHALESGELAVEMMKEIFGIHGTPEVVYADRGTSITSKTVTALLSDLEVTTSHSRAAGPTITRSAVGDPGRRPGPDTGRLHHRGRPEDPRTAGHDLDQ